MAQTVTVPLVVPYRFPPAIEKHLRDYAGRVTAAEKSPDTVVRTYDEQVRDISEALIISAMTHVFGDNMPRTDRALWRKIQDQLTDDVHALTMDGSTFEWFAKQMQSDKVKVHPADVSKYETFVESLAQAERTEAK